MSTVISFHWYFCMAGASAHYAVDGETLMLGAPGAFYYHGTVIMINGSQTTYIPYSVWNYPYSHHQYPWLGFSMTSGHFSSVTAVEGVTGAPRYGELGRVSIFDVHQPRVTRELTGEPVNTYFGSSVEAVDLNMDGFSDLLVGAPYYSNKQDEGCVYVYINELGELKLQVKLFGSNAFRAQFGSSIKDLDDLNKDGFRDVAIGAPYEDDNSGAVYIYHGTSLGINSQYAQRIAGRRFGLTSFGTSLSGALDLDGNDYLDLIVGAHQNSSVVYLRTRPVINMQATLTVSPSIIIISKVNRTGPAIVSVQVCLSYSGISVDAEEKGFEYTLEADFQVSSILQSRVLFASSSTATIDQTLNLTHNVKKCSGHTLTLERDVSDLLNPIPVRLSFSLADTSSSITPVLNPSTSQSITKEIGFGRICGNDDICQADLEINTSFNQLTSGVDEIHLGGDASIDIVVEVDNLGEEAHQSRLIITHPGTVIFEGAQTLESTGDISVKCELVYSEEIPHIECNLGNPMTAQAKVVLKVRLDISSLRASSRELNVSLSVSTSSEDTNLDNNDAVLSVPVNILADVKVNGASTPMNLLYKQDEGLTSSQYLQSILEAVKTDKTDVILSSQQDGSGIASDEEKDTAIQGQGVILSTPSTPQQGSLPGQGVIYTTPQQRSPGQGKPQSNETVIGPSFVQLFEVINNGPSRIPYSSQVNLSIPWRTLTGDWLIFINGVKGRDGVDGCTVGSVIEKQQQDILDYYEVKMKEEIDDRDKMFDPPKEKPDDKIRTTFDCVSAVCVTIQCYVQPLLPHASVIIELKARLWRYSFLKSRYGISLITSNVSVQISNPQDLLSQPVGHLPDTVLVNMTVSGDKINAGKLPVPKWVIPLGTSLGLLLLAFMILGMAKVGFFRRKTVSQMKKQLMKESEQGEKEEEGNPETNEMLS